MLMPKTLKETSPSCKLRLPPVSVPSLLQFVPLVGLSVFTLIYAAHYNLLQIGSISFTKENSQEVSLRLCWGISSCMLTMLVLASLVSSMWIVWAYTSEKSDMARRVVRAIILAAAILFAGFLFFCDISGGIAKSLYEDAQTRTGVRVHSLLNWSTALSGAAVVLIAAACCTIAGSASIRRNIDCLAKDYRQYLVHLMVTAALLTIGIVQVFYFYRWLFLSAPEGAKLLAIYVPSISATLYSIIFALLFLPVYATIRTCAFRHAVRELSSLNHPPGAPPSSSEIHVWLAAHGLAYSKAKTANHISLLASPMVADLVLNLVSRFMASS